MEFILGCMGIAVKSVLGGFFICVVIVLLGLLAYGFNYGKNYIKESIERKYSEPFDVFDE